MSNSHQEEIAKLEALFSEHPEGRVFTHLAEAWRKAGDLDRAREILGRGLEHHPDYSSAHVVLGRVLLDMGDRPEAVREFRRVLELDAHNLVALRALGDAHRDLGEPGAALEYYRELAQLDPTNSVVDSLIRDLEAELGAPATGDEPAPEGASGADGEWGDGVPDWDRALAAAAGSHPTAEPIGEGEEGDIAPEEPEAPGWEAAEDLSEAEALDLEAAALDTEQVAESGTKDLLEDGADLPPLEPWVATEFDAGAGPLQELPRPVEAVGDGEDAHEVATETMGDLYFQQGLYGRASGVYRRLLLTRPGDPRLIEKLERAERSLAPAADLEGGDEGEPEPAEPWSAAASREEDREPEPAEPWSPAASREEDREPEPAEPWSAAASREEDREPESAVGGEKVDGSLSSGDAEDAARARPDSEIPYAPWSEARDEVDAAAWSLGEPWDEAPESPDAAAAAGDAGAAAPGEAAPAVGEYFSALLAWRPADEPPWIDLSEPVEETAETPAERFPWEEGRGEAVSEPADPPELDLAVVAELVEGGEEGAAPTATPAEDDFPWETQGEGEAREEFPWEERPAAETREAGQGAAPAGDAAPRPSPDLRDDAFPWEQGEAPSPRGAGWEAPPAGEPGRVDAPQGERETARPGARQPEPAPEEEDEEDLEMFRSWLQSLKR